MIITLINLVLPVCSIISLSKSARIFIPHPAVPQVFLFVWNSFLVGLQGLSTDNPEEQPAKWRRSWQHVTPSTGLRDRRDIARFWLCWLLPLLCSRAKRCSRKMQTYRSSSIHNWLALSWVSMQCKLWAQGPYITAWVDSLFVMEATLTSTFQL